METGKEKCERLKAIRKHIAEQYGLEYVSTEFTHKGERALALNAMQNCVICRNSWIRKGLKRLT